MITNVTVGSPKATPPRPSPGSFWVLVEFDDKEQARELFGKLSDECDKPPTEGE